ncbi:hypothetical protein BLS_004326 [Venturia inaequalis]|uniref:Uncharacterized protein n=1 Tax=Venturia inaequalis TaxID=5025 RepID=A0A8H3UU31_VENIN|nr:hypothetical protein BLS_004326 [Venturia inaequalis]KAE9976636.1 hypothetical protein EG328_002534 [Venturia inaequalis]
MSFSTIEYDPTAESKWWDVEEDVRLLKCIEGTDASLPQKVEERFKHTATTINAFNKTQGISEKRTVSSIKNRYYDHLRVGCKGTSFLERALSAMGKSAKEALKYKSGLKEWDVQEDAQLIRCREDETEPKTSWTTRFRLATDTINAFNKARGVDHKFLWNGARHRYDRHLRGDLVDSSKRDPAMDLITKEDLEKKWGPMLAELAGEYPDESNLKSVELFLNWAKVEEDMTLEQARLAIQDKMELSTHRDGEEAVLGEH